jgi:hypothetical protein
MERFKGSDNRSLLTGVTINLKGFEILLRLIFSFFTKKSIDNEPVFYNGTNDKLK